MVYPNAEPIEDGDRSVRIESRGKSLKKLEQVVKLLDEMLLVKTLPISCLCRDSYKITKLIPS